MDGRDIAVEMLRVGWARVASPHSYNSQYLAYQQHAMSALRHVGYLRPGHERVEPKGGGQDVRPPADR
ncbi:hypothetical protein RGR602_PB00423 (plasmid) [Rhizobium gallicum bv. gallicum R602sp]|uniref:Uncharacterized protein n=1 Tax=Rhizobium gallicum bv. gallicum R602sp TaxID=1041138 RepID=A0A0B4XBJ2_9HYPH|nr:hypothetical protein RGR602_PB00423 [Rhizobium gallicum bv. gallicum R602sp]